MFLRRIKLYSCAMLVFTGVAAAGTVTTDQVCLDVKATTENGKTLDSFKLTLNYTDISVGSSQVFGQGCIEYSVETNLGTYSECFPMGGAANLYEGKFDIHLHGSVISQDYGYYMTSYGDYHISLVAATSEGSMNAVVRTVSYPDGLNAKPNQIKNIYTGTVAVTQCK